METIQLSGNRVFKIKETNKATHTIRSKRTDYIQKVDWNN